MPPRDEENTRILIQIAGDIGETREGIANLKENVNTLTEDFKVVKEQIAVTVKQPECTQRHVAVAHSLDAMKKDLIAEIKRVPTGVTHTALTPDVIQAYQSARGKGELTGPFVIPPAMPNQPLTVEDVENAIEEKKEEKAEKKRKAVTFWLATISTGVALFSGCAVGIYRMVTFMNKLEETMSVNTQEVRSEIQKTKNKVIYVHVKPDGSIIVPTPQDERPPLPPRTFKKIVGKKGISR